MPAESGHGHLSLAGLCLLCVSITHISQAPIAMVTLKMVLVQASQNTLKTQELALPRQGLCSQGLQVPRMWLLKEGPRRIWCPQGCVSLAGRKVVEGACGGRDIREKGAATKWVSPVTLLAWMGSDQQSSSLGRCQGLKQPRASMMDGAGFSWSCILTSQSCQHCAVVSWLSLGYSPKEAAPFCEHSLLLCSQAGFSLCAFIKADLCLLFNPPGSPVRCFCSSSYPALIFSP